MADPNDEGAAAALKGCDVFFCRGGEADASLAGVGGNGALVNAGGASRSRAPDDTDRWVGVGLRISDLSPPVSLRTRSFKGMVVGVGLYWWDCRSRDPFEPCEVMLELPTIIGWGCA